VAAPAQRGGHLADARAGIGHQRVQDRRLPHSGLADQHAALAFDDAAQRLRGALGRALDDRVAEARVGGEARAQRVEAREVGLVRDQDEAAAVELRRDDPAVEQVLVDRDVVRDDADDLRDVGGDHLLAKRVGAVQERAARLDRLDRGAAGNALDADPVTAGHDGLAALEDALDDLAAVEADREVAAKRRHHQPHFRRAHFAPERRATSSVRAAHARSFCVMPPASCVDQRTVQRPHPSSRSGWWSTSFATSDTALTNAIVARQSAKRNIFSSAPSASAQPASVRNASSIAGPGASARRA
jgi:hypothetical protein